MQILRSWTWLLRPNKLMDRTSGFRCIGWKPAEASKSVCLADTWKRRRSYIKAENFKSFDFIWHHSFIYSNHTLVHPTRNLGWRTKFSITILCVWKSLNVLLTNLKERRENDGVPLLQCKVLCRKGNLYSHKWSLSLL